MISNGFGACWAITALHASKAVRKPVEKGCFIMHISLDNSD
jgi:hypothetical protein